MLFTLLALRDSGYREIPAQLRTIFGVASIGSPSFGHQNCHAFYDALRM